MRKLMVWSAAFLVALGARGALAQPVDFVQGPFGPNDTWNVYEYFTDAQTWADANDLIDGLEFNGVEGHLVDVMSDEENRWLQLTGNGGDWWIGLTDREGAADPYMSNGITVPQESNATADDLTMGWAWTSGKPFSYQAWGGAEPNDAGAPGEGEDAAHIRSDGLWNDHRSGFDIDEPISPVLGAADSSGDEFTRIHTLRYIVEYPVEANDPIDGVDAPGLPGLCPVLPGSTGVDGQMAVTDFYGGLGTVGPLVNVCPLIQEIIDGDVEPDVVVTEQLRLSDIADPENPGGGGGGGPILRGPFLPFPSDTPNDDDDFISIAKGTFTVDEAGTYTIQVRSDDGFGLRVNGKEFTSVNGLGYKDGTGAMAMNLNTGDSNTRGVIELEAGEHSFEAMMWERAGGARWEMTLAQGAQTVAEGVVWKPLVDLDNVSPPIMATDLPGVEGGAGTVGVTDYADLGVGAINNLGPVSDLVDQIKAGDLEPGVIESAQHEFTAAYDPSSPAGGTWILGTSAQPFPSDTGVDDDDFISIARGTVDVPESGTYTIQVRSDDGFGLRFLGTPFTSAHGGNPGANDFALIDRDGSLIHPTDTGDANTRGVIELTKGPHQFEFLFWERGGGARWEISSSSGAHPDANTANWLVIGDATVLPEIDVTGPGVATLVGNARVIQEMDSFDSGGGAPYILDAIDEVQAALTDPAGTHPERDDVSTVLIFDAGSPARPSQRVQGEKFRFPANEGDDTDFNNFSAGIFGKLMIDDGDGDPNETIPVTFGMFTDDHSAFQIIGENFTAVGGSADTELLDIDGDDALSYDLPTGNSNSLGLIALTEGVEYDFAGYMHENGGGANYEIWAAPGDQLGIDLGDEREFLSVFYPLSNASPDIFLAGNMGLALIEKPDTRPGDYNNNGRLDVGDLDLQAEQIVADPGDPAFDLDNDGEVTFADRQVWINDLAVTWMGDANLNCVFDSSDQVQKFVQGKYEKEVVAGWADGDSNGDMRFNSSDMVADFVSGGYEKVAKDGCVLEPPVNAAVSAVPEPSSLVLVLLGLAGLVGWTRRR